MDEEITKLEKALKQQAKEDPDEFTYRSVSSVGLLSAKILSNELGNISQFQNKHQLFSYIRLAPSEYSSGENIRKGHITRQGNSRVSSILIEVAWRAIGKDTALAAFFERLFPHAGKMRAIVVVARKLIGRIRAAFQQGKTYCIDYQGLSNIAA